MNIDRDFIPTVANSSILLSLSIGVWTARKKDKTIELEVQQSKGAGSRRAASVNKNLFAECKELEAVANYAAECRVWFTKVTLPWDDNGGRILPMASYMEVSQELTTRQSRYMALVDIFCNNYGLLLSKQAFELGSMYDRDEYPDVHDVRKKFRFEVTPSPFPRPDDFRLQVGADAEKALAAQYEKAAQDRIAGAVADLYGRLAAHVGRVQERMAACLAFDPSNASQEVLDENGRVIDIKKKRRPKLYDSLLDNGLQLCEEMRHLNITNDPKLEELRVKLYQAMLDHDIDSLKESPAEQKKLKAKMDDIAVGLDF